MPQEWLVRSGHRTEHQIEEVANWAVMGEWQLPMDDDARHDLLHDVPGVGDVVALPQLAEACRRYRPAR